MAPARVCYDLRRMKRLASGFLAVAAIAGCLSGAHAYLDLSEDYRPPREFPDPASFRDVEDTWLRNAPLGLEGHIAAILEDPAVYAAQLAYEASRSGSPGRPGKAAEQGWEAMFKGGSRLPIRIRWRFNKHFHRQATLEPTSGWAFTLTDDQGNTLLPVEIGSLATTRDAADWVGEFRVWFPRTTIDGRRLITTHTRQLTLHVAGRPGDAQVMWRFRPLLEGRD